MQLHNVGIVIKVFHNDHNPPHIHVGYAEFESQIEIATGKLITGKLPPRSARSVEEWRKMHVKDLQKAWNDSQNAKTNQTLGVIYKARNTD